MEDWDKNLILKFRKIVLKYQNDKYLGVQIDQSLDWKEHVSRLV